MRILAQVNDPSIFKLSGLSFPLALVMLYVFLISERVTARLEVAVMSTFANRKAEQVTEEKPFQREMKYCAL